MPSPEAGRSGGTTSLLKRGRERAEHEGETRSMDGVSVSPCVKDAEGVGKAQCSAPGAFTQSCSRCRPWWARMVPAVSKLDFLCHRVAAQLSVINTFCACCPAIYHDKHPDYPLIQQTRLSDTRIKKKNHVTQNSLWSKWSNFASLILQLLALSIIDRKTKFKQNCLSFYFYTQTPLNQFDPAA